MSGLIPGDSTSDLRLRYAQRYNELCQNNTNNNFALSSVGNLSESGADNGQYYRNKEHRATGTLTTGQFYNKNSNQNQLRAESNVTNQVMEMEGSSTFSATSDAFAFKKPLPVKKMNWRPHLERRFDLLIGNLRSIEDKPTRKFMLTVMETLLHAVKNPPHAPPVNPVNLMDYISRLVNEEYFSKRVPKSICGSSVASDQTSYIDQDAGNSERSVRLNNNPSVPSVISDSRVILRDITQSSLYGAQCNRPSQYLNGSEYSSVGRAVPLSFRQQELSRINEAASNTTRHSTHRQIAETLTDHFGSTFNMLNDSEIARRRDEAAARQEESVREELRKSVSVERVLPKKSGRPRKTPTSTPKPTVNASKVSRVAKGSTTTNKKPINRRSKELVPASETCAELSFGELNKSNLNESMTLRNKKVLDIKKSATKGSKVNTPPTIPENQVSEPPTATKSRGRQGSKGKENMVAEKKKPVKKQTATPVVKNAEKKKPVKKQTETPAVKNASKIGKANKKKDETPNVNTEKSGRKPAQKRKSKEASDDLAPKKKKIEDPLNSDSEEDDIFGAISYKKPTHQTMKVALSPSAALLSAKKAAGEAQGKATPPCKAIGDMMLNESFQSTMSAAKEVPKRNEAVNRIVKKFERDQLKPPTQEKKAKPQAKKTRKEDSQLDRLMESTQSSYYVQNPMCSATLTVLRGTEPESGCSDMEEDYDDDLI